MKLNFKVRNIAASIGLAALSGMVYADDTVVNLALPTAASFYTNNFQSLKSRSFNSPAYLLAANEGDVVQGQAGVTPVTPVTPAAEFKPPLFSGRKAHQYLGLGTIVLAGLAAVTAPGEGCENCPPSSSQPRQTNGTHAKLGKAAAAMAAATVMTGLLYHWDDFHLEDGWTDPDNLHVMLGTAGALLMLYAVDKSAKSSVPTSHAGTAELGAVAMVVAIKLTW
jgi:hypothetical protein